MKQKRWMTIAVCALLMCAILTGCASAPAAQEEKKPVELTIVSSNNTHGTSLDPAVDYCGSRSVHIGVCETLFRLNDETLDVECHLASDYRQLDDTSWEITVRDDVKFSNGKTLTAQDVKASLEYSAGGITRIATMMDIASMEADGQLLTIRTNAPVATLPRILSDVATLIFDTEGSEDYAAGVIGTGPYILESMDDDGNCELVKNADYWQGMPGADRVHTKFITDPAATTLALQSGELDYATVDSNDVSLFENSDKYEVLGYETGRVYFLYLNPGYTFTEDPALREALTYAFDRQAYLDAVYDGRGKTTTAIFPDWSGYSNSKVGQADYNMDTAKQILADAGYVDTDADGFLEKDGQKVTLNITCYARNGFDTLSEVLQASLKQLGLDSDIMVSDAIVDDLTAGNFNIATYGYTTLTMGDCYNYLEPVFRTGASSNFNGFSSEKVDALLDQMKATSDTDARKALAVKIQEEVFPANEHVFLLHISTYMVVRSGVQNVTPPLGSHFNLWKVTK